MIFDDLRNIRRYKGLHANLDVAIDYLLDNKIRDYDLGKYEIDGENAFLLVQDNQLNQEESNEFEYHERYADIHFLLEGFETTSYGYGAGDTIKEFDESIDFGSVTCQQAYPLELGYHNFAIFFPQEYHQPNGFAGKGERVKKCVVKVRID